jgi:acetylornithine deacetylase/succinyl-diaminopimelate desuccinylase-like protein
LNKSEKFAAAALLALLLLGTPCLARPAAAADCPAVDWLQEYLRLDTTNPPGQEHLGAAFLLRRLRHAGIQAQLLVTPEGRTSLYARLSAAGSSKGNDGLLLLHHLDVVPPGPGWTHAPFSGQLADGAVWGRGAIDAKSLGIAHLCAFLALQRLGEPLRRDVVFLATADEESGGQRGTQWLWQQHPDLFEGIGSVLNEGGVNRMVGDRLLWWGIEVDQKRPLWLRITASGRAGHASALNVHTASHRLIRALDALLEMPARYHVAAGPKLYLEALAPLHSGRLASRFRRLDEVVREDGFAEPLMPGMETLFLDTVQITVLEAGDRINVVAGDASAQVDVRLLPDTDSEEFLARVRQAVGKHATVEVLLSAPPGTPSSTQTPLFRLMVQHLEAEAPAVPAFIAGFTDSRYFRQRGIAAYGLSPFRLTSAELQSIHAADERISARELELGVDRVVRLVTAFAKGEDL